MWSLQLWRHKRQSLGQEEPHRGCWVVAQAESTGQTCAECWLERDLRLQDLRLAVEDRHKGQWDMAGRAQRLLQACLLPGMTLRNASGVALGRLTRTASELGGGSAPWSCSWAGASWEPRTTVTRPGSSHPLPAPQGRETLRTLCPAHDHPPPPPHLCPSCVHPSVLPGSNDVFVSRELGQSQNKCKILGEV